MTDPMEIAARNMPDIKILIENRKFIHNIISDLNTEQLLKIPGGFKTNLLWNIGHLNASQQILHYYLSNNKPHVSEQYLGLYRKGSSPDTWQTVPDITETMDLFFELPEKLMHDYNRGIFSNFQPYPTSAGVVLTCIEDSLAYNNYHEGIHTGIIQCMKKWL